MRAFPADAELQASGCAALARAPIHPEAAAATMDAVMNSQLLPATMSALLRHPASSLVQTHGARALLTVARAGASFVHALMLAEGVALL